MGVAPPAGLVPDCLLRVKEGRSNTQQGQPGCLFVRRRLCAEKGSSTRNACVSLLA